MMNLKKFTLILTLLTAACLTAFAQTDTVSVKTIVTKTANYNSARPAEKVYLHLDKPYYAVGDTVWFAAYVTIDVHQPSTLSKVVYVDILSSKDSLVQKLKLPVTAGVAFGDVTLSKPLYKQDNYHIRAYTNWMRNSNSAYFFNKTVPVGTSLDKDVFTNLSLTGSVKNNIAKVDAAIHYSNPGGRAYVNRKLTWKVQDNNDETISKGKGSTDNLGNTNINFTTNKTTELNAAVLLVSIELDNKTVTNSYSLKHAIAPMDVQFFPEGGDLVNGNKSKVAFKAISPNGLGVDVKGNIIDNTGAVVTAITSQHLGMGVFEISPVTGKTYKAAITFPDGSQNTYDLPKAKDNGVTVTVSIDAQNINVTYALSEAFFQANKNRMLGTIATNGQEICYAAQTPLTTRVYSRSMPKSSFPTGVIKLTAFAPNGDEMAERIFFIRTTDLLDINLKTDKTAYTSRQKVSMNVSTKRGTTPTEAKLSIAIIDDSKVPYDENAETTILTHLLLTSDLKGYVEKPNYYFTNINDKTDADLDVLMLTQGYTHFVYKDVLTNKLPELKFLPEDGIQITGTLRTSLGMPVKGNVNFAIKDKYISLNTTSNQMGEFKFSKLFFPDSVQAVLSAKGNYNSGNMMILVDNNTNQPPTPNITAPDEITNIDTALSAYLQNNKTQADNSHILKEVVIKGTTERKPSHEDYSALIGLSMLADQTIQGANMTGCTNLFDCFKTMALKLIFDEGQMYIQKGHTMGDRSQPVAVYFNNMSVDYNYLSNIKPEDVESVEVFLDDGLSGINRSTDTKGVLVVNSKKVKKNVMSKDDIKSILAAAQTSAITITPKGYNMARFFYSPKYTVDGNAGIGGDLRSTIYWNPKVLTDINGNATFDFFNADGKGTYRAIIEGIDNNGNIGRTVYKYKVN